MTKSLIRAIFLTLCCPPFISAGEPLKDLNDQKLKLENSKLEMLVAGLVHSHPRVKTVVQALDELCEKIENVQENLLEVIIMLDGTKSHFMAGHPRYGKTEKAISELLLDGWEIHKFISTGTKKKMGNGQQTATKSAAYVWLRMKNRSSIR